MADRQVTAQRRVTNIAQPASNTTLAGLAEITTNMANSSNEAKINKSLSQAQLEINEYSRQFQIDNQSEPSANKQDFIQGRQDILDRYGADINPLYRNQWVASTRSLTNRSDLSMQTWEFKQSQKNTINDVNDTMQLNFKQSNIDGQEYGRGDTTELESVLNFQDGHDRLYEQISNTLGEEVAKTTLKDYQKDAVKSFVAGVSSSNTTKAMELLQDDKIKGMLSEEERTELGEVIAKNKKKLNLAEIQKQDVTEEKFTNLINESGQDYYTMRLAIDKAELTNDVSAGFAKEARRVLSSQKEFDAVTSSEDMSEIVTQLYDLNATQDMDDAGYLTGIKNIRNKMMRKQANGKLSGNDVRKLNNQIKTLTANKVAKSTQNISLMFGDAKDYIDQVLPPEQRGEAVRQLFYDTQGKDLDDAGYKKQALKIVDNITNVTRTKAQKKVNKLTAEPKQGIQEGTTIKNPSTGERMIYKDGKWQKI